jgi:Spy/CpxP family protein refolding chaperone
LLNNVSNNFIKRRLKMKKVVTIIGIVLLVAALAAPAFSYGRGWGKGDYRPAHWQGYPGHCRQYDRGYENLTEEQRAQLDKLYQKFHDENALLRNEIRSKSVELGTVLNSPNPDAEKAMNLQAEINDLKAKLAQNRVTFWLEMRKIAPEIRVGRGYGRDFGPGKGYGPGGCWR